MTRAFRHGPKEIAAKQLTPVGHALPLQEGGRAIDRVRELKEDTALVRVGLQHGPST
jgi:hypothetical protein